ncbi:hypothetical protein [Parasphingorhabdus sp.]|uniref:hypothetical protein n=1 Tax=Parasphingorhabdus sp. TaxID=2709688 RepID=UPI00326578AF
MEEIVWGVPAEIISPGSTGYHGTLAAGLFGRAALSRRIRAFNPTNGYIRELEQMPNFAFPTIEKFMRNYLQSNALLLES